MPLLFSRDSPPIGGVKGLKLPPVGGKRQARARRTRGGGSVAQIDTRHVLLIAKRSSMQSSPGTGRPRRLSLRGAVALSLCLANALTTPGCGGDSASFPPTLISETVFELNAPFTDLDRFGVTAVDFTVPAGTLQITVDWTSSTDDLDIVLSNPACDSIALAAGICRVLATESSNLKPSRLVLATTATSYRLFVLNLGPARESGTIAVKVTQARISF